MTTDVQQQIISESPEIEAYKKNLLSAATNLQAPELPAYQVAGMSPQQYAALYAGEQGIGAYAPYLQAGTQNVGRGTQMVGQAANMLRGADTRGQFGAAQTALNQAAMPIQQMGQAQRGIRQAQGTLNQGIGSLYGAAQGYNPYMAQAFMDPYQQSVVDNSMREIERQGALARQQEGARAVAAGAFGGSRQSVARAALDRDLMQQKANTAAQLMSQGYSQAQANAMTAFEQQKQRQLAQAQGYQSAAGMGGQLAGQQANIYGQQSQLGQQLAQGIGNLANQQFNIGQGISQGLAGYGGQLAGMGAQQAQLGQAAQAMGQNDVNFLYNLGGQQQQQQQRELDALRATQMQNAQQPYQQLGFISDIYKGAPTSQMALTQQTSATPSPFQQIAGLGTGIVAGGAAAKSAGII
jgi:hypothetical protein